MQVYFLFYVSYINRLSSGRYESTPQKVSAVVVRGREKTSVFIVVNAALLQYSIIQGSFCECP
jgi:hypothetical protein